MYYPYRVFVTGDRSFNNYFLYSYYLNGYANDQTVLYSAKPSHIDNMTEVFASSKNIIHMSCDADNIAQQVGREALYKKIAQATNFAIIFRDPNHAKDYQDLIYAFVAQEKDFRIIDIFPEDIITPERYQKKTQVKFSDIYQPYIDQAHGFDKYTCYKFFAITLSDPDAISLILKHKNDELITENKYEEQIACNLEWIYRSHCSTLRDIKKNLLGETEEVKTKYKETKPYDWIDTGENIPVYTGAGLLLANGYHSIVFDKDQAYIEIEYSKLVRAHVHQSLYTLMYEETDEDETDRMEYHTSDTEAYPIFYQTVTFAGSPFKARYWYINAKYVTVQPK